LVVERVSRNTTSFDWGMEGIQKGEGTKDGPNWKILWFSGQWTDSIDDLVRFDDRHNELVSCIDQEYGSKPFVRSLIQAEIRISEVTRIRKRGARDISCRDQEHRSNLFEA
jgi:hypothetical protein